MDVPTSAGGDAGRRTAAKPTWALVSLVVVLVVGLVPGAADATDNSEHLAQIAEMERRVAELEQRAEDLRSGAADAEETVDELGARLDQVTERLEAARERETAADERAQDARARAEQAATDVAAAELEFIETEEELAEIARRAYVHSGTAVAPMFIAIAATEEGLGELGERLHYLERTVGAQAAALETATSLTVRLAALREHAVDQQTLATRTLRDAEAATRAVATAHAEVLALTDEASRTLMEHEQQLELVAAEQQALTDEAEALAAAQAQEEQEKEEAARVAAEARTAAHAQQEADRVAAEARPTAPPAQQGPARGAPRAPVASGGSNGGLVTVRGITVAASLGPQLEALLAAAAKDGFVLGGSGYRSPEVTARLRVTNDCPDVYDSPASSCRIPTARPGTSEHEKGLAVDFTWQGQTICYPRSSAQCSGNAAFDWLRANAGRFGFRNLPSEAWHWSPSGR